MNKEFHTYLETISREKYPQYYSKRGFEKSRLKNMPEVKVIYGKHGTQLVLNYDNVWDVCNKM